MKIESYDFGKSIVSEKSLDFISKHNIALKEAGETKYRLKLLTGTGYITERQFESMYTDCSELEKLLTSIIKTAKKNNNTD